MNIEELQTGDILLISDYQTGLFNLFLSMIRYGTHSDYVHVAMVLKAPTFIDENLNGTYIWESGYEGTPDPADNRVKLGVQLTPIKTFIENYQSAKVFVRKFNDYSAFKPEKLKVAYDLSYSKPYDINPKDWIYALFQKDIDPQHTSSFWCSALVGFILVKVGILKADTDWSIMRPCDFALDGENLNYTEETKLLDFESKLNL